MISIRSSRHRMWWPIALLAAACAIIGAAGRSGTSLLIGPSQLSERIRGLIERKGLRTIRWGICVARADTGKVLFSHCADDLFIPASNRKLFVTALALDRLGPDFRFTTSLGLSTGLREGGQVPGDVSIRGSGDPTFLNPRFNDGSPTSTLQEWADLLHRAGVRDILGDLVVDGSGYAPATVLANGWIKNYETAEYAPRPSAVGIGGNRIAVTVRPAAKADHAPIVEIAPPTSVVKITNLAMTGPRRTADTIAVERNDSGLDHLVVRGRIAYNAEQQTQLVPLEQPALVMGDVFRSILRKRAITVHGTVRVLEGHTDAAATQAIVLAEYRSPPLREILAVTNKNSDNYCAEQIFQAVAFAMTGRTSYEEAKKYEEQFLAEVGILPSAAIFEDGSGLSRLNLVTPRATVRLLCHMANHRNGGDFIGSLSVAGRDGTLKGRMGRDARGRVYGKTGYLSIARCLSGYAQTRSAAMVAFAIFANDCEGRTAQVRDVQDRLCQALVNMKL